MVGAFNFGMAVALCGQAFVMILVRGNLFLFLFTSLMFWVAGINVWAELENSTRGGLR